ncbi:trans-Golgi network-localized SYP41-interacting protein 1 isoform X1 [Cryptomeria japonica]|uniref:trans-Golgi network-localized SYP41-interacting protein 1 isoform X1 n=3 Tax=Cryptomeria japonica TaxID=3369 RepID=UPI0027D9FCC3|nr:trans-Golgi network-localized SYP41-interacting protein 1 isoform X1 [Cryptomeria japonica]
MDKNKTKDNLLAAGRRRLQEFRDKKQSKGGRSKTSDRSIAHMEHSTHVQNDADPGQKPDLDLVASVPSIQDQCSENSNTLEPASGGVEESRDEDSMGSDRDGLSMGEVFSIVESTDVVCSAEGVQKEKLQIDDGQGNSSMEAVGHHSHMSDGAPILNAESAPAGYTELEQNPYKPVEIKFNDEMGNSTSDVLQGTYCKSSVEGTFGEDQDASVVKEKSSHVNETLHPGRLAIHDVVSPEVYQQGSRDEGLLQATQVDTGDSLVMSSACDKKPPEVKLLHLSEGEKHKVLEYERAFDVSSPCHPSTGEEKNIKIESFGPEIKSGLPDNDGLLSEIAACKEALMQAREDTIQLTEKNRSSQLEKEQLMQDRLHLEEVLSGIRDENFTLKTSFEATTQILHAAQEQEYFLRSEQSANKGLAEENAKLITEMKQLKQALGDMEREKSEIASALGEFRTQFQSETEGKAFISNELEIAEQKLHEDRGEFHGHIEAADIEMENVIKERLLTLDELQASQSALTVSESQTELKLVTLQQKLQSLESEKFLALSQLRKVHQMVIQAESASFKETEQTEDTHYYELSLINEIEKFVEEAKVRKEEYLDELESLRYQLQLAGDEKDELLLKLNEQANVRMEFEINCQEVAQNIDEMRALIDMEHKGKKCLVNPEERYELHASNELLEKQILKDEVVFTREQTEQLRAQTCQLKNQLHQIIEDKFRLMAELDEFSGYVAKINNEKEELVRDLCLTKDELKQVSSKAGLQENLEDEKNHLGEENRKLLLELHACEKQVEELKQDKIRLTSNMKRKEKHLFIFYEELARAYKELVAIQKPKGETNLEEVGNDPVNILFTNVSQELTRDNEQLIDLDRIHEWEAQFESLLQMAKQLSQHTREVASEWEQMKNAYGSLEQQLQSLEGIRVQSAGEINRLQEQLQDERANLMQDLHNANNEMERMQQDNSVLQHQYELALQKVLDLETHREKSDAEIDILKSQLRASAEAKETLHYQLLEVEKEKEKLATDLDSCRIQLKELDVLNKVEKTTLDNKIGGLEQWVTKQNSEDDDKVLVLKACLFEAVSTSEKLQKLVQEMIHDQTNLNKGSRRAPAGISKLIRAFEAKSQYDDVILEAEPMTETDDTSQQSSEKADHVPKQDASFVIQHLREVEDNLVHLRTTLNQVDKDTDSIQQQIMEEQQHKGYLEACLRQLEVDVNVMKEKRLEQDEVLATLTEKNAQLMEHALLDASQIENLNIQLNDLQKHANEESVAFQNQLETMQKGFVEQTSLLEAERSSYVFAMLFAAQNLEQSIQVASMNSTCDESDPPSVDFRLTTIVNATIEKINELRNLEAELDSSRQESLQMQRSFENLTQKFETIQLERESLVRELLNIHKRLGKLIEPQEKLTMENKQMTGHLQQIDTIEAEEDAHSALAFDLMADKLDKLVGQLHEKLEERLQFERTASELESALSVKNQHIEELEARCLELSKKCIENENCVKCAAIEERCVHMVSQISHLSAEKDALSCELVAVKRALTEEEEALKTISEVHNQLNGHLNSISEKFISVVDELIQDEVIVTDPNMQQIYHLESHLFLLIEKYKTSVEQQNLFKRCLAELVPQSDSALRDIIKMPLDVAIKEAFSCKEMELTRLQERINEIESAKSQHEEEIKTLKELLHKTEEDLKSVSLDRNKRLLELEQTEQKLSSVREKLSMAVSKGKGLVQQRDALKQSLAGKSDELERCWQELQFKNAALQEAETKLKSYGEAGERVEALESELAYIRNSATALRESFLQKDSVLQKIEEILEELNLPEEFHYKEITEKIEWLVRSCSIESAPLLKNLDQEMSERDDRGDMSFQSPNSQLDTFNSSRNEVIEDLRRRHEELQHKYLNLAEQSDMLEQSLLERNQLIQRWEEVLDNAQMPLPVRSMEPEDRIEWLGRALNQVQQDVANAQLQIGNVQSAADSLSIELDESQRNAFNLETHLSTVKQEKELLLKTFEELTCKHECLMEQVAKDTSEKETLYNDLAELQAMVAEQESNLKAAKADTEAMLNRLIDMIEEALQHEDIINLPRSSSSGHLEGCLMNLIHKFKTFSELAETHKETNQEEPSHTDVLASNAAEVLSLQEALDEKEQEVLQMGRKLEEATSTVASYKSERDNLLEKCRVFSGETEALKNQRDALQIQLEQSEQKLTSTKDKLSIAVKKGKGVVQQRDSLKQTMDEKLAELEHLKSELQVREFQIRDLSSKLDNFKILESEAISLRNYSTELEESLHESKVMLQRIMTVLDASHETEFSDPVKEIESLIKKSQELELKTESSEQEVQRLRKAAELLAAELDEVNERMESLEDELTKAQSEVSMLKIEKNAAESAKNDAVLHLEHALAVHAEDMNEELGRANNQNSALLNLGTELEHLRKEHDYLLQLMANDFFKKLELLKNLEDTLQKILSQLASSKGSKMTSRLIKLHEEGKFLSSGSTLGLYPDEHARQVREHLGTSEKQTTNDQLSFLGHELEGCIDCVEIFKKRFEGQSATFNEKATGMLQMMQFAVQEVVTLAESVKTLNMNVNSLEDLTKEKDHEIVTLNKNIGILIDALNNVMAEFQNVIVEIKDVEDSTNSEGWSSAPFSNNRSESGFSKTTQAINQVGFTDTDSVEIAEKLMLAAKNCVNIQTEKFKCQLNELSAYIQQLQQEAEEREAEKSRACGELQIQLKNIESVANSLACERDMNKERIRQLEKNVETLQNNCHALELSVEEYRVQETCIEKMQEEIRSLHNDALTKSQEVEVLMQALDEADVQMESLSSKVKELENAIQKKQASLESLESSRGKAVAKLSATVNRLEDLRKISEGLLAEVESLQLQLESRDAEISRLRQEVTRCTDDVLSSQENMKRKEAKLQELEPWLERLGAKCRLYDGLIEERQASRTHALMVALENWIAAIMTDLDRLSRESKNKDALLQDAHNRMNELSSKVDLLETDIHNKQIEVERIERERNSGLGAIAGPEVSEIEEMAQISKRSIPLATIVPHVRNLRKSSNDQLALNIDVESGQSISEFEDDEKGHVFKSLVSSRLIPKVTRPIADRIDGIWVSGGRVLMRQPSARLGLIVYWIVLHLWMMAAVL